MPASLLSAVWIAYLLLPLHLLQQFRVSVGAWTVPVYYFVVVPPVAVLALHALSSKRGWSRVEAAWWLWPLALLGSVAFSLAPAWSLREALSWALRGFAVGGMFLLWSSGAPLRRLRWVYAAAVAAALVGILEVAFDRNPLVDPLVVARVSPIPEQANPLYSPYQPGLGLPMVSRRPLGTQGNRIPYAASLLPFFSLALAYGSAAAGRRRWAHGLAALAFLVLFALSGSFSVLAGLAVLLLVKAAPSRRKAAFGGALLLPLAGGLWLFAASAQGFKLTGIRHRLESYRTVGALEGRALFGAGYGQYPNVYRAYYRGPLEHLPTPDNQYLRWLVETGIWGTAALAAFLAWLIRAGLRRLEDAAPSDRSAYRAVLAGWAGLATTFLFFDGFYWGACNMTFWAFLGLWAAGLKPASR